MIFDKIEIFEYNRYEYKIDIIMIVISVTYEFFQSFIDI